MPTSTKEPTGERFLRLPDVEHRTGLRKTAIYQGMKEKAFPACLKLGARCSVWPSSLIDAWMADRIAEKGWTHRKGVAVPDASESSGGID